jgi:predicted phage-related endonuclease
MVVERIPIVSEQQWLEVRRPDITASVIAAVWGRHPYTTIAGLHARVSGIDMPGPDPNSAVILRGTDLEEVVAKRVKRKFPSWKIIKAQEYFRAPELHIGATPDFFVEDPNRPGLGILQAKTVGSFQFKRQWADNNPPAWISLQIATEMLLSDASWGMIAALEIGDFVYELHTYAVERHEPAERKILAGVAEFWRAVEAGEEPVIDPARDGDLLALIYPREVPGKTVDLRGDNEILELLDRREQLRGVIKDAETRCETTETAIKAKIGDAEAALVRGWHVSLKLRHRKEHITKASSFRQLYCTREP